MIAQLTGLCVSREDAVCVIDVHGVGYLVHVSSRTLTALPAPPEISRVLVETIVREDAIILYGFIDTTERDWFRLLTTVQGVGGKLALAILSTLAPASLHTAIASGDKLSLGRTSGVGPKLAQRLVSELASKVGSIALPGVTLSAAGVAAPPGIAGDVLSALGNLGYRRHEAEPVVVRVVARLGEEASFDDVLRAALKDFSR
jgi:Holliday junction DNA helicase RuvA